VKQILSNLCRASVAAAGVMVAASAAHGEARPLGFETEFDLPGVGAGTAIDALGAVRSRVLDVPSAAAKWEESIGSYLDALVGKQLAVEAPAAEVTAGPDATTEAVVKQELKALAGDDVNDDADADADEVADAKPAAAVEATAVNPLLLAPVLSHPMECEQCRKELEEAAAAQQDADQPAAEAKVDDEVAQQNLADWAADRASGKQSARSASDTASADAEGVFFDDASDDAEPTN